MSAETEDIDLIAEEVRSKPSVGQHYAVFGLSLVLSIFVIGLTFSETQTLISTAYLLLMVQTFLHSGFLVFLGVKCWSYYRLSQKSPFLNRLVSFLPFVMVALCYMVFFASPVFLTFGYLVVLYSYSMAIKYNLEFHPDNAVEKSSFRNVTLLMIFTFWASSLTYRWHYPGPFLEMLLP